MCWDAPLIKQPSGVQTTLASGGWRRPVPPRGRCSRCCCPTSSSALWRYLGRGNDAALQDGQREASTVGFLRAASQSKVAAFAGGGRGGPTCRRQNPLLSAAACAHKHTTRVGAGLNKTGGSKSELVLSLAADTCRPLRIANWK